MEPLIVMVDSKLLEHWRLRVHLKMATLTEPWTKTVKMSQLA